MRHTRRARNGEITQGPDGQREDQEGVSVDEIGAPEGDAETSPPVIYLPTFPHAPGGAD